MPEPAMQTQIMRRALIKVYAISKWFYKISPKCQINVKTQYCILIQTVTVCTSHRLQIMVLQSNFNGFQHVGTIKVCSRQGYFEPSVLETCKIYMVAQKLNRPNF